MPDTRDILSVRPQWGKIGDFGKQETTVVTISPETFSDFTVSVDLEPLEEQYTEIVIGAEFLTDEEIERIVVLDGAGNIWRLKNPYKSGE